MDKPIFDINQIVKREKTTIIVALTLVFLTFVFTSVFVNYGKNCPEYKFRWIAQIAYIIGDKHLDGDKDGKACE